MAAIEGEYIPLDYPDMPWRADPAIGMDGDGTIYAAISRRIFSSSDGGQSWSSVFVEADALDPPPGNCYDSLGVLHDGTLLWGYHFRPTQDEYVAASKDGGRTWSNPVRLDKSPHERCGGNQSCLTELPDGTVLYPTSVGPSVEYLLQAIESEAEHYDGGPYRPFYNICVFRSTDGGRTWPQKHDMHDWSTETSMVVLRSGKLVAAIRYQRHAPPGSPVPDHELRELADADAGRSIVGKRVFLKDSDDGGRTWTNFRPIWRRTGGPMDLPFGDAHGQLAQLPDGRVLLTHEHRYPREECDIRARVSHDEGRTWQPQIYHLSYGCGYGASVVTDDGMIVTVCGNTPLDPQTADTADGKWYAQVVRWRLPANSRPSDRPQ